MLIVIAVFLLDLLIISSAIGIAIFTILKDSTNVKRNSILLSFLAFFVLDIIWLPAFKTLDLSITTNNKQIAEFLGSANLSDIVYFDWTNIFMYVFQAFIAYLVINLLLKRVQK